jgi:crossover junction endodeoxyribonuclease RusA
MEKSTLVFRLEKKLPAEAVLCDISVELILLPPDRRRRDIDNYTKAIFDGLTHARVWGDDSQVKDLRIRWGQAVKGGGFRLIIKPFVDGPTAD